VNDASREKDESHAGKVVERHWYNRWVGICMSLLSSGVGLGHAGQSDVLAVKCVMIRQLETAAPGLPPRTDTSLLSTLLPL
jgi:hypothetical protein